MSESLSRDGLIERVRQAWLDLGYEGTDIDGALTEEGTALYAAAAVDAVLRAVADDLERESRQRGAGLHIGAGVTCTPCAESDGLMQAAERVRDLLGKDKTNE